MKPFTKKIQLHIGGMYCVNCQNKIKRKLKDTKGIVSSSISYNNGTADIVYDESKITLKEIISVIESLNYKVMTSKKQQKPDLTKTIRILTIIVVLYVVLESMGILNMLVPSQLADTNMGYGMLFVIGLITSVHCIAMCGGINLSQCIPQINQEEAKPSSNLAMISPAILYNLGRVLSYTAVGFLLGFIGFIIGGNSEVGLSLFLQGTLKIIAGLFMVIMGINMLGIFPWLRKFTVPLPQSLTKKLSIKKASSSRPFIVGVLNGFMPCGPLQSMWIVALAAGNPFTGALSMFLFSLGTVPLMLGLGSIVSVLGKRFTDKVMTIGAVLVVVLGLAMLSQGGSLNGRLPSDLLLTLIIGFYIAGVLLSIPIKRDSAKKAVKLAALAIVIGSYALWTAQGASVKNTPKADTPIEVVDGVQVINSTLESRRYPNITVKAGLPVKWVINAREGSLNGCNYKINIKDYNIEYTFHTGENIIEFTPTKTGTVNYSCWMGMINGRINVMDD